MFPPQINNMYYVLVAVMPFGKWKLRKVTVSGNMERLNRWIFYVLEKNAKLVRESSQTKKDTRATGIVDFHGFSWLEHGCFKCKVFELN